jgi:hypothetical protein
MVDTNPWTFGLNQLLTSLGLLLTIIGLAMAGFGLRTFSKWRREKIEERKIELAFEALSLAYESKAVFGHIRSRVMLSGEGADVPPLAEESEKHKRHRQSFYAVLKRIEASNDYFARVWKLQPKFIAVFGDRTERIFDQLHRARSDIEAVASTVVFENEPSDRTDRSYREQSRAYVENVFGSVRGTPDPVNEKLDNFRKEMDALCLPVVDRTYRVGNPWWHFWQRER